MNALPFSRTAWIPVLLLLAALARIGDASASDPVPKDLASVAEASRLLARATFGPTRREIDEVVASGFSAWIDAQMKLPASELAPRLASLGCFLETAGEGGCPAGGDIRQLHQSRDELWWQNALYAPDQLRQRVAFALSEVLVVSMRSDRTMGYPLMLADYYDTLARGAFGSYRDLLEEVTLHPAMGAYLAMVKNQKPDADSGMRPDENYARECLQLFSIGTELLNPDGTWVLDESGSPVPTYDQEVVIGVSRAFTGWNLRGARSEDVDSWVSAPTRLGRMEPWEEVHDSNPKRLLDGFECAGGLTAREELGLVLDLVFEHPNTGPFLGKQLIQRLVTSNPSPAYVARVSAVFDDNGAGERGDLGAVVHAILTDPEAVERLPGQRDTFGKVREPLLRMTALLRAFDAEMQDDLVNFQFAEWTFGQAPLASPSVFNFFLPDYCPPGPIADAGLVAPEMQITTHTMINRTGNVLARMVFDHYQGSDCADCVSPLLDLEGVARIAEDATQLIDHLDAYLLGGTMSAETREVLELVLPEVPYSTRGGTLPGGYARVQEALFLLVVSPDFAVQK